MTTGILAHNDAGVLTLTFDRADKKNALSNAMYTALAEALEAAETEAGVRAILLRAEGDIFTAGNDVREFAAFAASGGAAPLTVQRFLHALASASKPVVAAVQGHAVGIGTTMLLHCDCVILAEDAQLSTPFVSLALVPEAASSLLLTARIGHVRAFSLFALGERVGAHEALAWGIASQVVPRAELTKAAESVARRLTELPLGALVATKRLMRPSKAIFEQMDIEAKEFAARLQSAEAREAFLAFAEKRAPNFARAGAIGRD